MLLPTPNHRVDASHKTNSAFGSCFRPAQLVFRWSSEQHEQPGSVGAKCFNHLVRIDTVAETLRHRFPFVSSLDAVRHHPLRQQLLDGLVEVDQTNVAHEL